MLIEKILFPTKFRELSFNSLRTLLPLKASGLKEIVFCHIIERDDVGFVPFGGYMKEEEEKLREQARIRFEDWQKSCAEYGIKSSIIIEVGEAVPHILGIAKKEKVDIMIVGRKKKVAMGNLFAGDHTLQLIRRSKVATLVSKYMVNFEIDGSQYERINENIFDLPLIVMDCSEHSERALNALISLNNTVKKAVIVHHLRVAISKKHDAGELHAAEEAVKDTFDKFCMRLKEAGIQCETHIGAGEIVEEILRISRERNATMLIMGTTGKDRLHEFFQGSISHDLVKLSELPVLLVP
ncbi:MAG: universal stress protein [Nitrospira sp.]|nr:universal stress protein [Nitrospira sp.]